MNEASARTPRFTSPAAALSPGARLAAMLVFLLLGGAAIWGGCDAIIKRQAAVKWKSSSLGRSSSGAQVLTGAEAVRHGAGLTSLGGMVTLYGAGLATGFFRRDPRSTGLTPLARAAGWLALACLLSAIVCFFPPWWAASIPFYAVALVIFAMVAFTNPHGWARFIFPCLIGAALVAGYFYPGAGSRMIIGLFASLGVYAHFFVLCPQLQERVLRGPGAP